ncbi:telomerase inhibitor [Cytospora paraplurivora]|uniref:Telomerase inhibitor n=1 Tax=Cytospora paraplurivora TaxID=2898453 RepID=A0AAN9UAY7_9PEZI
MGLAGQKNKRKWAKDPNNTAWSRNTDTFGHKIMRSQGWAPGDYLGAKDASHSEYFGSANASHIRAVVKDDNMGLGARRNQGDECTGLDALQDLLSRLNGRADEAVAEDRRKREDTRMSQYLARRLGTIRFVYGGLLVGDKVQELADSMEGKEQGAARVPGQDGVPAAGASEEESSEEDEEEEEKSKKKEKKSKKRKAEEDGEGESKKQKKSRKRKTDDDEDSKSKRKEKKDKKRRKEKEDDESRSDDADEAASARKKAKKEKKEKRRKSKEDGDDDDKSSDDSESKSSKKKRRKAEKEAGDEASPPSTKTSTPAASGISTPTIPNAVPHRHLARSRFIAQKRAAVMDQAALNQIFMIKA